MPLKIKQNQKPQLQPPLLLGLGCLTLPQLCKRNAVVAIIAKNKTVFFIVLFYKSTFFH